MGFSEDSANGGADYQVTPMSGTLQRRGSDPTPLMVTFKPLAPGGTREVFLVVETEESRWTYHIIGDVK